MAHKTKAAMPGRSCHCTKLKHIQNSTLIDQVNGRNHSVSSCLSCRDCLRWRRLTSPRIEVTIKPALLSPSFFNDSISATTSCGTLTVKSCDFAFLLDVAIAGSLFVWCVSVYAKKRHLQCLKCVSLVCKLKAQSDTHLVKATPSSVTSTNRASNHKRYGD